MTTFRFALVAAFLFGPSGAGYGAEPARPGTGTGAAVQISSATSEREDDAFGLVRDAASACSVAPRFSTETMLHGQSSGDPEKDSVGFGIAGHTDCAGASAPH